MNLFRTLAATALVAASLPALAIKTYDFSFNWFEHAGGPELVGSFDGTDDGVFVHNITNLSAKLDGVSFLDPLTIMYYSTSGQSAAEPAVSFDITKNNFFISNNCTGAPGSYACANNTYLLIRQYTGGVSDQMANAHTAISEYGAGHTTVQPADLGTWSLTARAPVPEPASYALMGAGLAALALGLRRRRA